MRRNTAPKSPGRFPHDPAARMWTVAPRLRCLFLAVVALSIFSILTGPSRLTATSRLGAFQTLHMRSTRDTSESPVAAAARATVIPRIIHQSWKNANRIPTRFHPWMKSWTAFHPAWTYVFWTDEDNLDLFENLYPQYLHVAKSVEKVSLADMARYALLHAVGGLYVDADFECIQPFDDLHRDNKLFLSSEPLVHTVLFENSTSPALCNALMASVPGHPFWLQVLDNIKAKFDREGASDPVSLTGPRIVKETYESPKWIFDEKSSDVMVFPSEYFYPEVARWDFALIERLCRERDDPSARGACEWLNRFPDGEFTKNTHATHHWQCTWCRDAHLDEFGSLDEIFETPMRPNITSDGIAFAGLQA